MSTLVNSRGCTNTHKRSHTHTHTHTHTMQLHAHHTTKCACMQHTPQSVITAQTGQVTFGMTHLTTSNLVLPSNHLTILVQILLYMHHVMQIHLPCWSIFWTQTGHGNPVHFRTPWQDPSIIPICWVYESGLWSTTPEPMTLGGPQTLPCLPFSDHLCAQALREPLDQRDQCCGGSQFWWVFHTHLALGEGMPYLAPKVHPC